MTLFETKTARDRSRELASLIERIRVRRTKEDVVALRALLPTDEHYCKRFNATWAYQLRKLDSRTAEDVLQGAYLRYHRRLLNFRACRFEVRSHLETVAFFVRRFLNCIRDEARQQRRHSMLCVDGLGESLQSKSHCTHPIQEIEELISHLPDEERFVLRETFVTKRSLASIGRAMNLSAHRVKRLRKRAIKQLRYQLAQTDIDFHISA